MTLPTNIVLPVQNTFDDLEDVGKFINNFTTELQEMYVDLAEGINGDIKSSAEVQRSQWVPKLNGTTTTGTFTYTHQIGWSLRQGLIRDVWFDIAWTASGTAAGNLYLELPYKVANSSQKPFSSSLQTSTIAYGAGMSILSVNATANTYRAEIWASGSGLATANVAVVAAGQLVGHLRYLGVQDET